MADEPEVISLLEKEIQILSELHELSLQKSQALLHDDLNLLESTALREETVSRNLKDAHDACFTQVQFFIKGPYPFW